ncbi:helix-turn-helix protein [Chitinophaga dinghuensis]|uniref:Helix-turn-helix protein n=1 Tax=Chitinophaga dinghuensis TaxID=1539050 RepID=A0A327VK85_9BACT|nr:helix-turn-helix domain-containing protein [Chitinophaga dinghuensis]RAJ73727.1 helix-turn-helix protein [Chitinophaga dinghuensis]
MKYIEYTPCLELGTYIHSFWELKGEGSDHQWERIFPDGCPGIVLNLGDTCKTDSGASSMDYGKTYIVGAMNTFKDTFIDRNTRLLGVCFKPAMFSSFFNYASQHELTNQTVEFGTRYAFDMGKLHQSPAPYLNSFFLDRRKTIHPLLQSVLKDIHGCNGDVNIFEVARRNYITVRQLERHFKAHIGLSPKEYAKIIRFQSALTMMNANHPRKLSAIAFDCGFYDQSHLTNEIKKYTGYTPAQL